MSFLKSQAGGRPRGTGGPRPGRGPQDGLNECACGRLRTEDARRARRPGHRSDGWAAHVYCDADGGRPACTCTRVCEWSM